jgi:hypothetical protein
MNRPPRGKPSRPQTPKPAPRPSPEFDGFGLFAQFRLCPRCAAKLRALLDASRKEVPPDEHR